MPEQKAQSKLYIFVYLSTGYMALMLLGRSWSFIEKEKTQSAVILLMHHAHILIEDLVD